MEFDTADARNLIYERSQEYWKIFVSSKMRGGALKKEREAAVGAVHGFALCRAWAWENDAAAGPYCSERECVAQAGTSDGLVLILEDELTDITRAEFAAARSAGSPVFMMLKAGVSRDTALEEFIKQAREDGLVTATFSSVSELQTRIASALRTWALRSGRSEMLRTRDRSRPLAALLDADDPFREMEVWSEDHGAPIALVDFVARAKDRVAAGQTLEALDDLYWVANGAAEIGLGRLSLELLGVIERMIPDSVIDDQMRGWLCNVRGLALSGSAASPEARHQFDRMRQLGRASNDADMESTALQNLGVQDLLEGDHDAAQAKFRRSLELKAQVHDPRRSLQVQFNLVNVLEAQGDLDRAERLLDAIEVALKEVRDPHLHSSLHGQRGHLAVARGDLPRAQDHFRDALRFARRSGVATRIITCMQNLGSVAYDLGDPARATRWYAKALAIAEGIDDVAQRRIQRQALARANAALGRHEQAAELFLKAAEDAEHLGDLTNVGIAIGDAGLCMLQSGDPNVARKLTERALGVRGGTDDWRAVQLTNLAAELAAAGEHEQGLARLLEAAHLAAGPEGRAAALRRAGETAISHPTTAPRAPAIFTREIELRRDHEPSERWAWRAAEIGATLSDTSQAAAAKTFFALGLRVFARRSDRREAFFTRNDRALLNAQLGDFRSAVSDLERCLQIAHRMRDRALAQQAHMNLGEIQRRRGDTHSARTHLRRSLTTARALHDLEAEAQTRNLLAMLAQDEGEPGAAREHLRAAETLAAALNHPALQGEVLRREASLAEDEHSYRRAASLYRRAARLLAGEPSRQLAECRTSELIVAARLGRFDDEALDGLPELSAHLGWDGELLERALYAVDVFSHRGEAGDLARLISFSLAIASRVAISEDGDKQFVPFLQVGVRAYDWFDGDDARKSQVSAALRELCGDDVATTIWSVFEEVAETAQLPLTRGTDASDGRRRTMVSS